VPEGKLGPTVEAGALSALEGYLGRFRAARLLDIDEQIGATITLLPGAAEGDDL